MWYEISGLYAGALDEDSTAFTEEECDQIVEDLAEQYRKLDATEPWEVYVLPHYCNHDDDDECVCAQYLTDHHPAVSFAAVATP